MGATIKHIGPVWKPGMKAEMGRYEPRAMKIVKDKTVTIKNIHRTNPMLLQPDFVELKEHPGHFLAHRLYKPGTLPKK